MKNTVISKGLALKLTSVNKDSSTLQRCLADPDSYTACQLYLADTNMDGYVNNKDLAYLRSHLADSELYPL